MAAAAISTAELNDVFLKAVDSAIHRHGEVGLQVAIYKDGELAVDVWGGVADPDHRAQS